MSTDLAISLAIGASLLALVYGALMARWIIAQSPGNDRMQEIAAAVQAGAQAYLNRQYITISIVGVVLAIILALALDAATAGGFVVGAVLSPPSARRPRTFLRALLWSLPLHVFVSIAVVGGAAAYYSSTVSSHGTWATIGSWSLTALCVVGALIGGALAGVLSAAQQTVERLELTLRDWLHALPAMQSASTSAGRSLATARQEYETMVDRCVTQTAGRLRLPRRLERLIRAALQGVVVDRFMTSCTDRGLNLVAPQEFRNWLLAEGVSLGFMPVQDQLSWWRYLILGLLALLVAMVLALAFLKH